MKKILVVVLLSMMFIVSSAQIINDWRPYNHWKIHFIKDQDKYTMYIDTYYIQDAIDQFTTFCSDCEIRSIARDFYEVCQEREY